MSTSNIPTPGGPPPALVGALKRLFRPLVRLLLAHQVSYPLLTSLLKSVYVEMATEDFSIPGKKQTDSRISLLSGVHRKDVKRLRQETSNVLRAPTSVSLGAQLVGMWCGLPQYLDEQNRPRPLPRLKAKGGETSFEALVASVNKDIRSRVVLDEWVRLGVASIDFEDRVCLNTDAFIPEKGFDEKAFYFGQNLHDHIAAGAHNLSDGFPPFLERSVHYNQLTPESVDELAELSKKKSMQVLQAINRRAIELEARDADDPNARQRMNFCIYYFNAPRDDPNKDIEQGDR